MFTVARAGPCNTSHCRYLRVKNGSQYSKAMTCILGTVVSPEREFFICKKEHGYPGQVEELLQDQAWKKSLK